MKPATIDTSRLNAAVDAVRARARPDTNRLRMAQRAKLAKVRRSLGKEMAPLFAGASFDAGKIDHVLARHQAEARSLQQKEQAEAAKHFDHTKARQLDLDNLRQALEHLALQPYVTTPIPVTTPYLISATPAGMLRDSHIEPWNNWAKFSYSSNQDTDYGTAAVNFYFAWQNESDYLAVLNCSANMLFNGYVEVEGDPGFLSGGRSGLDLMATLTVFVGATQRSGNVTVADISVAGGWFGAGEAVNSGNIFATYQPSCLDIYVPANGIVVFELACNATWYIDGGGSITFEFGSDAAGYSVLCPTLQIDLLTQPWGPIEN